MLTDTSPRVEISKLPFDIALKPHQAALVYKALEVEMNHTYGIMGDKPGCGKTYAILSLIWLAPRGLGPTIIVVPHNIYSQWRASIERFIGKRLKWRCFADYADISSLYFAEPLSLYDFDILLTTSLYFNAVSTTLSSTNTPVYRVVFDEADSISSSLQNPLVADKIWFVSASIDRVISGNMGKIGKYMVQDVDAVRCMCDPAFIEQSMAFDAITERKYELRDVYIDEVLRHVVDDMAPVYANTFKMPFMSNKKASDPREFARTYFAYLHDDMAKLTEVAESVKMNIDVLLEDDPENYALEDLNDHYREVTGNLNSLNHKSRAMYNVAQNAGVFDDMVGGATVYEFESKVVKMAEVINEAIQKGATTKVIVFSQHYDCLAQLYTEIPRDCLVELDGGSVERMDRIVARFRRTDKPCVMLMDSTIFGVGLDLEGTTDVIFAHKVESGVEKQVIGRALRMSRDPSLPLHIHRFAYVSER